MAKRTPKPVAAGPRVAKLDLALQSLRSEIVQGRLPTGQRLPPIPQLAKRIGVSVGTAQLALNQLAREGFLEVRSRQGTFLREKLPCQSHYALVFHIEPRSPAWSTYYSALTNAAVSLEREQGCRISLFHGVDHHQDNEETQRLLGFLRAHRLAGIAFANAPSYLTGSPLLDQPGLPRVAIASQQLHPLVSVVALDGERLYERAVDHLIAHGRRRIATVTNALSPDLTELRRQALIARNVSAPSYWRQYVSADQAIAASNCVELLLRGPAADRPDGLIITDDNLVEHGLSGLIAAGVRVPQDVEVVVHCNFPWVQPSVLPVKRIGFDILQTLRTCLAVIDQQRRGQTVTPVTVIPPIFEEELTAPPARAAAAEQPARFETELQRKA